MQGINNLTETEYQYATQVAVWATCGQISVPGTAFTAGRASVVEPTSDAQKITIFDSVKAILRLANGWSKYLFRAEENQDVRGVDVMSVTLTAGRTAYLTVADDTEKGLTIKKVDGQKKASLQGAVFRFELIDGGYVTTGFDGTISFEGDELPYGSYRITEQSLPDGYVNSSRVETVEWNVRHRGLALLVVLQDTQGEARPVGHGQHGVILNGRIVGVDVDAIGRLIQDIASGGGGTTSI